MWWLHRIDLRKAMEAATGTRANSEFGALLDDLFVATEKSDEPATRPSIPFDYLAVVEELHSGRIRVSGDAAAAEYQGTDADAHDFPAQEAPPQPQAVEPDLPLSVDPRVISAELGLATVRPAELGRLRRTFALKNHPDRVAPHLRPRALARMQVANGLIDEAKRRAEGLSAL